MRLAANKKMKNEAIAERIEYLTNAMVDRIDMVTSLEHALGRTSKALSRARMDERLLVERVRNLEEQGLRMSVLVKRVADTQRMAMNTNKELVMSMQKNESLEKELDEIRVSLSSCLLERNALQNTLRDQESELKSIQAETSSALAKAKEEHAEVVERLESSVRDLECGLKSQRDDAITKRAFFEKELNAAVSRSKVHELENEKLRSDNQRLEKSFCEHRDTIAKLEARAEEQQRKLRMSHDESKAVMKEAAQENATRVSLLEASAEAMKRAAQAEKRSADETQAATSKKMDSVKLKLDESEGERARLQVKNKALTENILALQECNDRAKVLAEQRELRITALEQSTENSDTCQSLRERIFALEEDKASQQDDLTATAAYCQKLQKSNADHLQRIEKFESLERARALSVTKSSPTKEENIALHQKLEASERSCEELKKKCKIKDEALDEVKRQGITQGTKVAENAAALRRMSEKLSAFRDMEVQCVALKRAGAEYTERILLLERNKSTLLSAVHRGKATSERLQLRMERLKDENFAYSQRILHYRNRAAQLQQQLYRNSEAEEEEKMLTMIWQLDTLREYCERLEKKQEFLVCRVDSLDKGTMPKDRSSQGSRLGSGFDTSTPLQRKSEELETLDPSPMPVTSQSGCSSSTHDAQVRRCTSIEDEADILEVRLRRPREVPVLPLLTNQSSTAVAIISNPLFRIVPCTACEWAFEPSAPVSFAPVPPISSSREIRYGEATQPQIIVLEQHPQAQTAAHAISQEAEDSEMSIQPAECQPVNLAEMSIFTSGGVDIPSSREWQPVKFYPGLKADHQGSDSTKRGTCTEGAVLRHRSTVCVVPGANAATSRNEINDCLPMCAMAHSTNAREPSTTHSRQSDAGESPDRRTREESAAEICIFPDDDPVTAQERNSVSITPDVGLRLLQQPEDLSRPHSADVIGLSHNLSHNSIPEFNLGGSRSANSFAVLPGWDFSPAVRAVATAETGSQIAVEDALREQQSVQECEPFPRHDELSRGRSNRESIAKCISSSDRLQSADWHDKSETSEEDKCLDTTSSSHSHRPDALHTALSCDSAESLPMESNEEQVVGVKPAQEEQYSETKLQVYEDQILRLLQGREELELRICNYQNELTALQESAATVMMERDAYLSQAEKLAGELGRMSQDCDVINRTLVWMREAHLDHVKGVSSMDSALVLQLISSEMERLKAKHIDSPASETGSGSQPGLRTHSTFLSRIGSDPEDNNSTAGISPLTVENSPASGGWSPFGYGRQTRKKAPAIDTLRHEKSAKQDAVWNTKPDWNVSDDYTEIAL